MQEVGRRRACRAPWVCRSEEEEAGSGLRAGVGCSQDLALGDASSV